MVVLDIERVEIDGAGDGLQTDGLEIDAPAAVPVAAPAVATTSVTAITAGERTDGATGKKKTKRGRRGGANKEERDHRFLGDGLQTDGLEIEAPAAMPVAAPAIATTSVNAITAGDRTDGTTGKKKTKRGKRGGANKEERDRRFLKES